MRGERALRLVAQDLARLGRSADRKRLVLAVGRRLLVHAGGKPPQELRRTHVLAYLASRSSGLAPTTYATEVGGVRAFLASLVRLGVIAKAPDDGLKLRRPAPSARVLLSEASIEKLLGTAAPDAHAKPLACALSIRDRAVLETLYGTGVRSAEVRSARLLDLDLGQGTLLVRRAKRGESRVLPLPPASVVQLDRYVREARPVLARSGLGEGRLFLTWRGKPLDRCTVWRVVRHTAERTGLYAHPHAFRRAIASHLVKAGVPLRAVQLLLGHRSLEVTQRYVSCDREELRRVVAILDWPR